MFVTVIPFILDERNSPTEYVFSFENTIVRQRARIEHIPMTGKLTCRRSPDISYTILCCFLQNVRYMSPNAAVRNENSTYVQQIDGEDTKYNQTFWFEINFNRHGAESISVKKDYQKIVKIDYMKRKIITDKIIIDMIIDIVHLFKIDSDGIERNFIMHYASGSSVFTNSETSTIGYCKTRYNMTMTFNAELDNAPVFQMMPPVILNYTFDVETDNMNKNVHVQIEKDRPSCDYFKSFINSGYNGTVTKRDYKMEIVNGEKIQLNISNTINVRQAHGPQGSIENIFVLDKTTLLNLTDISNTVQSAEQHYDWDDPFGWIFINI